MKRDVIVGVALGLILLFGAGALLVYLQEPSVETSQIQEQTVQIEQAMPEEEPPIETEPEFDEIAINEVVSEWLGELPAGADAGIQITDSSGNILASHDADEVFFAASIYKLYVAYEGYKAVDAGDLDPQQTYVGENTLSDCLDIMIRESDSPCAEKLWNQLGKESLNETLKEYGLTNTDMVGITTSAADAAVILQLIASGEGLSEESQMSYLASMKDQVYDDTFDVGFSDGVTVYNKIGFRDLSEYHDVAIVELEDERQLILSVLSSNVGTQRLRDLGSQIEAVL